MKNHCVGHPKMKPIDVDELFYRNFIINELESSLNNDDKAEASVVAEDETKASFVV